MTKSQKVHFLEVLRYDLHTKKVRPSLPKFPIQNFISATF